jgi:TPR repeat protein
MDTALLGSDDENADAQYTCFLNGTGVSIDNVKAVELFTKSAAQGHAGAQYALGSCYLFNNGVPVDKVKAVEWYTKSAAQGHAGAQCALGHCYFFGNGVPIDRVKAVEWYGKSTTQGDTIAKFQLVALSREPGLLVQFINQGAKESAMTLLRYPIPKGEDAQVLRATIDMNDTEVMECVCNNPSIDLNVVLDGQDSLRYAEVNKKAHSASMLIKLRLEKIARVVLVGPGGSGKTRLRKDMQGREYKEGATELLEIDGDWRNDCVHLRVWDFAGQAGDYAAQTFFLADNNIGSHDSGGILLVIACMDVRKSQAMLFHELDTSVVRMCNSRKTPTTVAFVATHCDKGAQDQIETARGMVSLILKRHCNTINCMFTKNGSVMWERSLYNDKVCTQLVTALVEHCKSAPNRIVHKDTHEALRRVRGLANAGSQIALLSGADPPIEPEHLMRLHDLGELFYQSGSSVVCLDVTAPLNVFRALLKVCNRSLPAIECKLYGWFGYSDASVMIEHNDLILCWKGKSEHVRFALRGCKMNRVNDNQTVHVVPRIGSEQWLQFDDANALRLFCKCVKANSMRDKRKFRYHITGDELKRELHQLGFVDDASCALMRDMMLSNRALVLNKSEMFRQNEKGEEERIQDSEYLMPFAFSETYAE